MKVYIKFYSGLEKYIKNYDHEKGLIIKVHPEENISLMINRYIPENAWGVVGVMILVNHKIIDDHYQVKEGDVFEVYPLSGGG